VPKNATRPFHLEKKQGKRERSTKQSTQKNWEKHKREGRNKKKGVGGGVVGNHKKHRNIRGAEGARAAVYPGGGGNKG